MKIIDIMNKIANGEELPKLKLEHTNDNDVGYELYMKIGQTNEYNFYECLNEEIEIIEEDKKIKRIEERASGWWPNSANGNVMTLKQAVNELIDEVNKLKGDKNEK